MLLIAALVRIWEVDILFLNFELLTAVSSSVFSNS